MINIVEALRDPIQRRAMTVVGIILRMGQEGVDLSPEQAGKAYDQALASMCPFDRGGKGPEELDPETPCPVCGDLGTNPAEGEIYVSKCVSK